ncbi:hypothetical protein QTP88_005080 [Uroleucon formosanum]
MYLSESNELNTGQEYRIIIRTLFTKLPTHIGSSSDEAIVSEGFWYKNEEELGRKKDSVAYLLITLKRCIGVVVDRPVNNANAQERWRLNNDHYEVTFNTS